MNIMTAPENAASDLSEVHEVAFDLDLVIDKSDYSRIMRRIGLDGDESTTRVCAFNSSI
jgi:hypothetical protein